MAAQPPFQAGASFNTQLAPLQEMLFRQWVQQNRVPFDVNAPGATDYDMRGYWQGLQNKNPMATASQVNANDGLVHYPDYYKTPLHKSFSSESQWAGPQAPRWVSDSTLAAPNGRVMLDERGVDPVSRLLSVIAGR